MDGVVLKQCARSHRSESPPGSISFRHPGYDDPEDILFTLPRLDHPQQGPGAAAGVHHGTALLACQIVANNAFDGYLTTDRAGTCRVTVSPDEVLLADDYWFTVAGDDVYPVVPRFEEWQFPHSHMASLAWDPRAQAADPATSERLTMPPPAAPPPPRQAARCVLSDNSYATQKAHIVPVAQSRWFQVNSMRRYGDSQQFINTSKNLVPIRHDLHKLWDDYVFTFVPKRGQGGHKFVVNVLSLLKPAISEFASEWHNVPVQEGALDGTSGAFLFAKFAQAVFMLLKPFIAFSAVPRHIATSSVRADDDPRFPVDAETVWLSASALSQRYSGGGSKSATASVDSRKRSRSQASAQEDGDGGAEDDWYARNVRARLHSTEPGGEDDQDEACWYEDNISGRTPETDGDDEGHGWYEDNVGWEERGRPRQRQGRRERSEHTVDTLPSLTDTSAAGDFEELEHSGLRAARAGPLGVHAQKNAVVDDDTHFIEDPA